MKQFKIKSNGKFSTIQKLIELGGENKYNFSGNLSKDNFYYIDTDGTILSTNMESKVEDVEEIFLFSFPKKMLVLTKLNLWEERIVICSYNGVFMCVTKNTEHAFQEDKKTYDVFTSFHVKEIPKVKKVTMREIEEKFGCKIKIVKNDTI
jgi:hypothetical protein